MGDSRGGGAAGVEGGHVQVTALLQALVGSRGMEPTPPGARRAPPPHLPLTPPALTHASFNLRLMLLQAPRLSPTLCFCATLAVP